MVEETSVGVVGDGPAVAAIEAALSDAAGAHSRIEVEEREEHDLLVVVGRVGESVFEGANDADRWIAVELGGIGGHPVPDVTAAISALGRSGCFECLRTRVAANRDDPDRGGGHDGTGSKGRTPIGESRRRVSVESPDARLAGAIAGRIAVAILDGDDPGGRVVEVPHAERRLVPVPNCSCAETDRDRTPRRGGADVSIGETSARAERAVDDRLGIVAEVGEVHSFPAPYYLAGLCETGALSDASAEHHAAGVAAGWDEAFVKAIGEALERYSAAIYRESTFEEAAAKDLEDAVAPASFVLPENGYDAPDPEEAIPWVGGADLHSGERVRLPAEFVHFPPPERRHKPSITTGLGLGTSGAGALLSGLYEAIERDATMLAWYSTFDPLELDLDDESFRTLRRRARSEGLRVTPLLVTQDVDVPVVSVAVHREGEWPRFAVGSSADLDPDAAAVGALCEALQNWMELRDMGPDRAAEEATAIGRYADFPREVRSFLDVGGEIEASSLAPGGDRDEGAELAAVLDRLDAAGLDAYASRLTPRDVESMGFEAVRVLVPAAQPLFTGDRYFGDRAREVPRELGYRPRFDRPPHPYP